MAGSREALTVLGSRVRDLRKAAGLRQEDLGVKADLNRSSIANLEAGRQDIPVSKLLAIAEALDVSPSALLPGDSDATGRALVRCQEANHRLLARISAARAALDADYEQAGPFGGES